MIKTKNTDNNSIFEIPAKMCSNLLSGKVTYNLNLLSPLSFDK